jgi:hypothetical protein
VSGFPSHRPYIHCIKSQSVHCPIVEKRGDNVTKRILVTIAACGFFFSKAAVAHAALAIVSFVGGQPASGVNYVTFDDLPLGGTGGLAANTAGSLDPFGGVSVLLSDDGAVVEGALSGAYAAPVLSNSNGAEFDSQPDGTDTTPYLTSGSTGAVAGAHVAISFSSDQLYFGLLWGSVDLYNTLEFYDDGMLVGTVTGSEIDPAATGDQGVDGTFYVNINSDLPFDMVVANSTQYAFELDNIAYGEQPISQIPEPSAVAIWSLLGFVGLGGAAVRRRLRKETAQQPQ